MSLPRDCNANILVFCMFMYIHTYAHIYIDINLYVCVYMYICIYIIYDLYRMSSVEMFLYFF